MAVRVMDSGDGSTHNSSGGAGAGAGSNDGAVMMKVSV